MSRVIKSLRNLDIGSQLSSKPGKLEENDNEQRQQQQIAAAESGSGKSGGGLLSRLKPGKQKSYENLLDAGSPTEERPKQRQSPQSGWATFEDSANLIDLSSPLPPAPPPVSTQPAFFIDASAPRTQQPLIIRSDNGRHGGSLECLSVNPGGGAQALFNPSFRKESPKAKAAPAPPPASSSSATQLRATRQTPPPRPTQPPPRPSQPPKVTSSASSNALLLLDLDFGHPQQQQQQQQPPQPAAKSRKAPAPPPPAHQQPFKRQPQQLPQTQPPQPELAPDLTGHLTPGSVCSAKFDLANPPDPGILSLRRGDLMTIVRREDDNWMVARRLTGDCLEGLVACSYLAPAKDSAATPAPAPSPPSAAAPSPPAAAESLATKARSLHEYRSDHPGDLSFPAGQLISEVRRVDSDWLEGRLASGLPGLFPANHVRLILYPATAAYAFPAQEAGDLALQVGDSVDVLAELPGGEWLRGVRRRRPGKADNGGVDEEAGNFPAAFVVSEESAAAEPAPSARAIHDFAGRESDELSFQAGDLLTSLTELGPDWLSGMAADGRRGMFPRAFVELL
ncbi:hypothetical protein BOX15_Mlig009463g1 [Macrostomum lignano]|uniref:SH3 domain-containing protein n=2 Tax=Macrostomum lignano TaxID=282301 RepID=A0A267FXA7_9PLAT|nr:hypothetical protein BOX15_Mlig009463g1 [Macrostomum lignano]